MARRRSSILDAIEAFNLAYDTTSKVGRDIELSRAAQAKPEEMQGFTTDDADQLRAAADSGQYDIGTKTNEDGTFAGYTVTPKADPAQTGTVAMQGVTDFMGKRTAGTMNEDQVDRARQSAMAGIITKYDPQEGMKMRREIRAQERDDQRWDRQTQQWAREDEDRAKLKDYEDGRKTVFSSSRFGQNQTQYQQQMADYQKNLEAFEAARAAGKTGPELGIAPVAPTRPEYTIGDALADRAALIDHDAKFGKLDAKAFGEFTDLMNKVQSEGYEKVLRLAQSGAPIQEVAKAFNASGQAQFDPASVVSDKVVKGKDGVETRVIQYRDAQGNVRTLNALAELDALGKAGDVFTRHFQVRQDQRAERADGRAATTFAQGQQDRDRDRKDAEAKANAAVAIYKENNPNATPAQLEAVRRGVIDAVPTTDKNAPSEVKLAKAMVDAGLAPDMSSALERALSTKGKSARDAYLDMMKPSSNGIVPNESKVATVMEAAYGPKWRESVSGTKAEDRPRPKNESDAHAQAKAALERGADKKAINERLKQMGFKPLP